MLQITSKGVYTPLSISTGEVMRKKQMTGKGNIALLLYATALSLLMITAAPGETIAIASSSQWYVSAAGTSYGASGSEKYPFTSIQTAINAASNGDTVWVGSGTYFEAINFKGKNITVASLEGADVTIIDGKEQTSSDTVKGVVTFENGESAKTVLRGFTITNGLKSGVYCYQSSPVLESLKIIKNSAVSGGGIFCEEKSGLSVKKSIISGNSAANRGAGIYCRNSSSLVLENVLIAGNSGSAVGGGVNCAYSSTLELKNVTLTGNSASQGRAVYATDASGVVLKNSIVWNNEIFLNNIAAALSTITVSYSDIQGGKDGIVNGYSAVNWSEGNIAADPVFLDEKNSDFRLAVCSPCIGAGILYEGLSEDMNGNIRPNPAGSAPDMGASEAVSALPKTCEPRNIHVDENAVVTSPDGTAAAPYKTVTQAIQDATSGSTIRVAKGIYIEPLTVQNITGLSIEGGWNHEGTKWYRDTMLNPVYTTVMSMDVSAVIQISNAPSTLISAFTIVVGAGVGIKVENSAGVNLESNIIRIECRAGSQGICYENSSGNMLRNRIHLAGSYDIAADAICLKSPGIRLENNIIYLEGNGLTAVRETGISATPAALLNNEFYGNTHSVFYHDENGKGNIITCEGLNRSLSDIAERGGNLCTTLPAYTPCTDTPCVEVIAIPPPEDTDEDELPDNFEVYYLGDITYDGVDDPDEDGLTNLGEYLHKTNPTLDDTDHDGMSDGWEVENRTDPLKDDADADPDQDEYSNLAEYKGGTDPNDAASYPFAEGDLSTGDINKALAIAVLDNDDGDALSIQSVTKPSSGSVSVSGTLVNYTPLRGFWGTDSFDYIATNSKGHAASANVTVYVRPAPETEKAMNFETSENYLIRESVNNFPETALSAEFWLKVSAPGTMLSYSLKHDGAFDKNAFAVGIDDDLSLRVYIADAAFTSAALPLNDGQWHHIAVTWKSADGELKIFKDGAEVFAGTLAKGMKIPGNGSLTLKGPCKADEFRLWNDARTPEEIRANMNTHLPDNQAALVTHWRFDEGGRQIAFDYSGSGNHAQLGSAYMEDEKDPVFTDDSPLIPRELYAAMPDGATDGLSLSDALENATPGSVIRVARGFYTEALRLENIDGVTVQGGWTRTDGKWLRDKADPNTTVIMAMNSPNALSLKNAPRTAVEGFTLVGTGGSAMDIENSSGVKISGNIIHIPLETSSAARDSSGGTGAAGLTLNGTDGEIVRNRIHLIGDSVCGIVLSELTGDVRIENNIIYLQGKASEGIAELGENATPKTLLNNEFYGDANMVLYRNGNGEKVIMGCGQLNDKSLSDISKRGGNFCNRLDIYAPCPRICAEVMTIPPIDDTDSDTMPDNWEIYYFNSLLQDGTADYDQDSITDANEYLNLTSPADWNLKVTIRPRDAADKGAQWSADRGTTWKNSGDSIVGTGEYAVSFKEIPGWTAPEERSLTVEKNQNQSVIGTYTLNSYTLNVSKSGCTGEIKINGEIQTTPWTGKLIWGEQVTLEAVPGAECCFAQWSGGIITNPIAVTMDSDKTITATFAEAVPYFPKPRSTSAYMTLSGRIFNASDKHIADGDEAAAYIMSETDKTANGLIVGWGRYAQGYALQVFGDDISTPEKDGAAEGDTIFLKTYNADRKREYPLTLISGDHVWKQGAGKTADWKYPFLQTIPLHTGWNIISFSVNKCFYVGTKPACPMIEGIEYEAVGSIGEILSSIEGQYSYVRGFDCTGTKIYNLSRWSDMTYMAAGYGYEIKVNDDADADEKGLIYLEVKGDAVSGDTAIPLQKGWNLVGYLGKKVFYTGEMPEVIYPKDPVICRIANISDAFCSIADQYSYVKAFDKTGATFYNLSQWSNLKYVGPGYGYWIKVTDRDNVNLVWDSPCTECGE
jgi:hypothetical protein